MYILSKNVLSSYLTRNIKIMVIQTKFPVNLYSFHFYNHTRKYHILNQDKCKIKSITSNLKIIPSLNILSNSFLQPNLKNVIHTNCTSHNSSSGDIPPYLSENIQLFNQEDFDEDELDEIKYGMEFEISDFFESRLINYEDAEVSFSLPCPSCNTSDQTKSNDIFVDKSSGNICFLWFFML